MDNAERLRMFSERFMGEIKPLLRNDHKIDFDRLLRELNETVKQKVPISEWKGFAMYPGFEAETAQYSYDNFTPRDGDVLVASYPKTGTTWTAEIVRHLIHLNDAEMQQKSRNFNLVFNYLEFGPIYKYEAVEAVDLDKRCFGTHLPSNLVNLKKFRKIIYVFRNPKDQLVSWHNFAKPQPYTLLPTDAKEFYDLHIAGKQGVFGKPGEGYLEHVKGWYQHRNDENILFLAYEDLKQEPHKHIREIADFIEIKATDAEISEIAENTSFNSMKKASQKSAVDSVQMFRKGQIGDWKNHLTVAQSEEIDRQVKEILGDTDIKFTYEQ